MSEHLYSEEEVKDLTDRVFLLRQSIEEGKIHFASHLVGGFIESYEAIRLRSDGLVDQAVLMAESEAPPLRCGILNIGMRRKAPSVREKFKMHTSKCSSFSLVGFWTLWSKWLESSSSQRGSHARR